MKPIHTAEPSPNSIIYPGFDAQVFLAAAKEAVREALAQHKADGDSVVVWRDGRVVIIPPEDIRL